MSKTKGINMPHNPVEYDAIAEQLFAPVYPVIAHAIAERTKKREGRLLDAGCGGGHLAISVLREGAFSHLTLLDENAKALELADARVRDELAGEACAPATLSTCCSDICAPDLAERIDGPFDLIVSRGSMPFWDNQPAAFKNLYSLLAPGGVAYVGGGMGSSELRRSIAAKMAEIRAQNGGEGPSMFDSSKSKALKTEDYVALFQEMGVNCTVIANEEEGRWFMFEKQGE